MPITKNLHTLLGVLLYSFKCGYNEWDFTETYIINKEYENIILWGKDWTLEDAPFNKIDNHKYFNKINTSHIWWLVALQRGQNPSHNASLLSSFSPTMNQIDKW